jgi:hypothetical protein
MLPRGAAVLSVGDQSGAVQLWALADDTKQLDPRRFAVLYTGFDKVPVGAHFIGTVISAGGSIVRHIFELYHGG